MRTSRPARTLRRLSMTLILMAAIGGGTFAVVHAGGSDSSSDGDAASLFDEGVTLVEKGDYEEALARFEAASEETTDDPDILNMLAFTQRKLGRLDEAFETYAQALELRPRFPQAREYLGEAHLQAVVAQLALLKSYGDEGTEAYDQLLTALRETTAKFDGEGSGGEAKW